MSRITFITGDDRSGKSTIAEALARSFVSKEISSKKYLGLYDDKYDDEYEYAPFEGYNYGCHSLAKAPQKTEDLEENTEYIIVGEPNPVFFKEPYHIVAHRIIDVRVAQIEPKDIEPKDIERESVERNDEINRQSNIHELLRRAIEVSSSALNKFEDKNKEYDSEIKGLKAVCTTAITKLKEELIKL